MGKRTAVAAIVLWAGLVATGTTADLIHLTAPAAVAVPGNVRIKATIDRDPQNRGLRIEVESSDYYRSSEVTLDGQSSPSSFSVLFQGIPIGEYRLSATLIRADGEGASVSKAFIVTGVGRR